MLKVGSLWANVAGRPPKTPAATHDVGSTISRRVKAAVQPLAKVEPWVEPDAAQTRAAERFVPRRTATSLATANGKKLDARIINMSALGVAVEADFSQVRPDTVVMVGSHPVKQGRQITLGTVFLFVKPLDPKLCNPDIVV